MQHCYRQTQQVQYDHLKALSTLRGLRGAPAVPPLCRETQSLGQRMLNATVGINGLISGRQMYVLDDAEKSSLICTRCPFQFGPKILIYLYLFFEWKILSHRQNERILDFDGGILFETNGNILQIHI